MDQNRLKLRVLMTTLKRILGFNNNGNRSGTPKTVSNSPRNTPELAQVMSVDDRHVNTPWVLITMEITLGPQNGE